MSKLDKQELRDKILLKLSKIFNRSLCPPYEVLLTLTNRCNLSCKFCSFNRYPIKGEDELKTGDIYSIIDQIASMGVQSILLSGGEPLLRDDLFDLIGYATKIGIRYITLLTNGTIINDEIIQKINGSGLKAICVSMDGLENNHDYIRGYGSFQKSIYFLQLVRKKYPSIYLGVTSVIMNRNLEDIPSMLQLFKELKLNSISFQPVIIDNTNWTNKEKNDDLWVSEERLSLLYSSVDKIIAFKRKNDILCNDYTFLESIKQYFCNKTLKGQRNLNCFEGFRRFTITAGGRIWICGREMKTNILRAGLKRCWNSSEVIRKRGEMRKCSKFCLQTCAFERDNYSLPFLFRQWVSVNIGEWFDGTRISRIANRANK